MALKTAFSEIWGKVKVKSCLEAVRKEVGRAQ